MSNCKTLKLFVLVIATFQGCVDVIEFDKGNTGGELTIYGKVTNSELHDQNISISRTSNGDGPATVVNTANVQVEDELGNVFPYQFDEEEQYYVPVSGYAGVPGVSYRARITVNESIYLSTFQEMPVAKMRDSTYFQFRRITTLSRTGGEAEAFFMQVYTDSEVPETEGPLFVRWDILQVFVQLGIVLPASNFPRYSPIDCYIEEPFIGASIKFYDGRDVDTRQIQGRFMAETLLDDSFNTLRGFGIVQNSITEDAFEYWQKIEEVSNRVGSIFETPPAAIPGNIVNIDDDNDFALGFFEVAQVDTTGTFVTPDDIPVFLGNGGNFILCNEFPFGQLFAIPFECFPCLIDDLGVHPACLNCTILPHSTRSRPTYLDKAASD